MAEQIDVLIVDDDQNMRLTLAEILSEDGYSVRIASTGEEAVEICRHATFRLVLMDVRMPGIDGVEAFHQIRKHCKRSQIALMSAYSNPDLEQAALAAGVLAFLRKPIEIEAIGILIAEVTSTAVLYIGALEPESEQLYAALVEHGFRASVARDVGEAVRLFEQINYDAVVLDLDAIEPAGGESVAKLHAVLPGLPVIVIHGPEAAAASEARKALVAGALAELRRPVATEATIALLETVKRKRLGVPPPPA